MWSEELAALIDHTLLRPEATPNDIRRLCREALEWRFHAVCINPRFVPLAATELAGSRVSVCAVVGFPLGATTTAVKAFEAGQAVAAGAAELDVVLPVGLLKAGDDREVVRDVAAVVEAAGPALVKAIIEAPLLTEEEIARACRLAREAGAGFVKTGTGFFGRAEPGHVRRMKEAVGPGVGVKAAGGIRTLADALAMLAAGADRLGTSAGVEIMREALDNPGPGAAA